MKPEKDYSGLTGWEGLLKFFQEHPDREFTGREIKDTLGWTNTPVTRALNKLFYHYRQLDRRTVPKEKCPQGVWRYKLKKTRPKVTT